MSIDSEMVRAGYKNARGDASDAYNPYEYNIDQLQYPADLGTNPEFGRHRVVFFINVQGGSKIITDSPSSVIDLPPGRFTKANGIRQGDVAGTDVKNAVGEYVGASDKTASVITKALRPKKRLKSAISLYVPESVMKGYGVTWGEEGNDAMANGEAIMQGLLGAGKAMGEKPEEGILGSFKKLGNIAGAAISPSLSNKASKILNGSQYAQKALSVTGGNSKAELLFKDVAFGQFTFDFKFAPRDEKEAANVLRIIRTFRHHMLPEFLDTSNFLYIYPSEFEVRYYRGDKENDFLERHITAVLTNMSINYTPNGQMTTFKNGMPTQINILLQFKELGLPNKFTSPADAPGA